MASAHSDTDGAPVWTGSAPGLADGFIDRPETGAVLEAALVPGGTVALVSGIPGGGGRDWRESCGKTQLAVSAARSLWQSGQVDLVIWLTATTRASVLSGYATAAAAVGSQFSGTADAATARFLGWLRDTDRPWLVVLDDLTAAVALDDGFPWPTGPAGRVLVTTAEPGSLFGRGAQVVPVGPFSRRESLTYLIGRLTSDLDQRQGAIDLVGDLDGEPLALAQASAVIASSELTCHDYREHFAYRRDQAGGAGAVGGSPAAGAITWSLSVDHAELLSPGVAQSLLVLTALLDGNAIPSAVLTTNAAREYAAAAVGGSAAALANAITSLENAGLIFASPEPAPPPAADGAPSAAAMMQMSWLVQAAVRAAMPDGMLKGAAIAAADALVEAWPADEEPAWLARSLRSCAETLRHAAGDLLWQGSCHALLLRAGRSLDDARLTGPAVTYWQELAATGERMLGIDHPVFFGINERLAQAYLAAGQAPVAVSLLQWVWSERARRRGPDHPGTIEAARNLGLALVSAGRFNEAVVVLTEVVAGRERTQGANSLEALTAHEDLGAAYRAAGSIFEAIIVYRRTLAERERMQGQRHPDVTATRQQLAEAYLADGRPKAAISQYERVVSDRERELGPDHLQTIAARGALGAACHAGGKMAAAVRLSEQTRTGYARLLGVDHPDTLAASLNLAHAYLSVGRNGDAAAVLEDTVERCNATLAPTDPLRVAAQNSWQATGRG
ncbi:MAG TPA: tetratricopeptide repeat protein [Trebonia sp.]|jgi:tetratricopeptide (TPR) repeat protein|nr:tetratricopeptide repeat protein [Trebonia sp.]